MDNPANNELKITLALGSEMTLRELDKMRRDLTNYLERELPAENAKIIQPIRSRAVDPAVIGTVSLVVLPVVLDKIGDLLVKWAESRKDCSATLTVPIKGGKAVFSFDPRKTSQEELSTWLKTTVNATKSK